MHTIEYYAAKGKKKSKYCHCDNMDGPQGHYAKWNKSQKDKYYMIWPICGN